MSSSRSPAANLSASAPGRPPEIEEPTNRYLVHPLSRALATALTATPVTPNQVSVASVFTAAAAGACFVALAWPWAAVGGLGFQFLWHVLDGADGDLARRTGRASPIGELVDGVCDHVSQAIIYVALAAVLARQIGPAALALALAAALSHFIQANAYESGRKTYRRWVYGAAWLRDTLETVERKGFVQGALGRLYVWLAERLDPGEADVEKAMAAAPGEMDAARALYRDRFAPLVRSTFWLGGNARTIAIFASMIALSPAWYFLFEIIVLNAVLALTVIRRRRANVLFVASLAAGPPARLTQP